MQLAFPIFLFFIKVATLHISPFGSNMKLEVSAEIWWKKLSCRLINMAERLIDWKLLLFGCYFYIQQYIFALLPLHKCDCIMINIPWMFCNYSENKSIFIETFWYLPQCSVCLQLRWLLWIRTQRGIIWFIWWVSDLDFSYIFCASYQEIHFYFQTLLHLITSG